MTGRQPNLQGARHHDHAYHDLDGNRTAKTEGSATYAYEYEPTDQLAAVVMIT
jgi:hypothetical protein